MHTLLLAVAIALAGQVAGGAGDRYGNTVLGDAATTQGQTPPQSILPQQPAELSPAGDDLFGEDQPSTPLRSDNTASTTDSSTKIKPSQLIRSLLKPPAIGQLQGKPLSLAEALQGASSRGEQTQRVEAYWDLSAAMADYYMALREVTALQTLRQSVSQPSLQWEQVRQILDQRGQLARRSAQAAQVRLQRMLGQSGGMRPLPSDFPHCGAYDTRFEEVFSGRLPSLEAQQLHELLPLEHQDLRRQAASVLAAHQWLGTVSQRRDPLTDGSGLLKAHELLSLRRLAFVSTLSKYNTNIARYAEIASPGQVGTGRLVAMLIHTAASQSTARNNHGIHRTSAEEAVGSRTAAGQQSTFDEGQWRGKTPPEGAERSILRRPKN